MEHRRSGLAMVLGLAAAGAVVGAVAAAYGRKKRREEPRRLAAPAYAEGVEAGSEGRGTYGEFRPAGPSSMRDRKGEWNEVDEASDESFPASDPPALH